MVEPSEGACSAERLLRLVRGGDRTALDWVTRCYGARLLSEARRRCRTADEAEDAVQDTLLAATTHLGQFRGEGSMEGWLVRIVENACRRIARGAKNDGQRHDSELELASPLESPELAAARQELAAELDRALLSLEPEDRLVLLLAEVEDWQAPEIAQETGLSAGAVRTRLTRLRARLREMLGAP